MTKTTGPDRTTPSRKLKVGGLVAAVAVVAGIGIGSAAMAGGVPLLGASPTSAHPSTASAAPTTADAPVPALAVPVPTPAPLGDTVSSAKAADAAVAALVSVHNQILQRADGGTAGLERVATGFVEGELQALALEREKMGLKQVGKATIRSVKTHSMDLKASPPTIVLEVCIDSSAISLVDANGTSMKNLLSNADAPVMNLYGAVYEDGVWKIKTHDIPANASCTAK